MRMKVKVDRKYTIDKIFDLKFASVVPGVERKF